jgi:tetraacyldisaccharide 4'-kinase
LQSLKRILSYLLLPFSGIYWLITSLRNWLYNIGVFKSTEFDIPIISVGNLAVGGTGKTPMVEWLVNHFQGQFSVGVLSRGYGRKTSGFKEVLSSSSPKEVGDEPLQIKRNYDKIHVCVCEDRVMGISEMIQKYPEIDLIVLDDAFQHRAVKPMLSILLTTHNNPFHKDYLMPVGLLREARAGYRRSDAIVVTKTPDTGKPLNLKGIDKPIFHSKIAYQYPDVGREVFGFSGLADNSVFKNQLEKNYQLKGFKGYNDHHKYSEENLDQLKKESNGLPILCTQKDWVKIKDFNNTNNIHVIKIRSEFISNEFASWIDKKVKDES